MTKLPPGVAAVSKYYICVEGLMYVPKDGCAWVARFKTSWGEPDRGWNISQGHADAFGSLQEAKKIMRSLSKRLDLKTAQFSIVELTSTLQARTIFPLEVLDALAQI